MHVCIVLYLRRKLAFDMEGEDEARRAPRLLRLHASSIFLSQNMHSTKFISDWITTSS
jgi:hypothetical protein